MATKIIPLAAEKIKRRKISRRMLTETIKLPVQIVEGYGVEKYTKRFIMLKARRNC